MFQDMLIEMLDAKIAATGLPAIMRVEAWLLRKTLGNRSPHAVREMGSKEALTLADCARDLRLSPSTVHQVFHDQLKPLGIFEKKGRVISLSLPVTALKYAG